MGLPRNVSFMDHVQTSQQPITVRGAFTPTPIHTMYGMGQKLRVTEIKGRYFGRCATCLKVWRVREGGCLGMCPVVQYVYRLHSSPPLCADHSHHTVPYADHAQRCESGRSQRTMGSLVGFPWLGECSTISITLLLASKNTSGRLSVCLL